MCANALDTPHIQHSYIEGWMGIPENLRFLLFRPDVVSLVKTPFIKNIKKCYEKTHIIYRFIFIIYKIEERNASK